MMKLLLLAAFAFVMGFVAVPQSASAATYTTTSLNMRAGPGVNYARVGVIPARRAVKVWGCARRGRWCEVSYRGYSGWVSSAYLTNRRVVRHRIRRPGFGIYVGPRPYYWRDRRRHRNNFYFYYGR
ncbi:hypothetical protein MNBD_ALPHA09-37 [hydrothermal vent metagenome]|uniref:SH3b domain-containing protein n=1 Tax=hydrothermal vent metagenome TaxID=652676 RepID=A0A3B0TUB0_9ZZZZ